MTAVSLVKKFFDSYIMNESDLLDDFLDTEITIDYSTLGSISGKEAVKKALALNEDFTYRYNILSNLIDYKKEDTSVVICNVFHFLIKEYSSYNVASATSSVNGQVFPLVYGGKYKFIVENDKIKAVSFDLEAQMGNTYWAKKNWQWHLYDETKHDPRRVLLDETRTYEKTDEQQNIIRRIYEFMLLVDTRQSDLFKQYVTEDGIYSYRDATRQGMGISEDTRTRVSIMNLVNHIDDREYQSHHSCRIIDVKVDGDEAEVTLEMFEPTKLGYKHLFSNNVYQPYYNEQWKLKLVKKEDWIVSSADRKAVSKFQKVSYKTLCI